MAGSSNFLQWNPTQTNQDNDGQYAADPARSGGAGTNTIFNSLTANKLFYQISTFVAAFAQMMASKGYNMSDANLNNLATSLAVVVTDGELKPNVVLEPYSANPIYDASTANGFSMALSGGTTITLQGTTAWQEIEFSFQQTGGGGFVVTWPASIINPGTPDPTPGARSTQKFRVWPDGNLRPSTPMMVSYS